MYRLMVVDDSKIIRNKIDRLTEVSGFKVVCHARNGKEAVKMCQSNELDVVTMDLTMPEMDGLQAIPKLLNIQPQLQILIVSALSDRATGLEALELGANGFLIKPFTEYELLNALHEIVAEEE